MSFVELVYNPRKSMAPQTGVRVSLRKAGKNPLTPAKCIVVFSQEFSAQSGFADGDKLQVSLGQWDDAGTLRLRKNNSATGAFPLKAKKPRAGAVLELAMGVVPQFPDRSEKAVSCQFKAGESGYIFITLPQWAREKSKALNAAHAGVPLNSAELIKRAVAAVPAPNFSGAQKPTRKQSIAQVDAFTTGRAKS